MSSAGLGLPFDPSSLWHSLRKRERRVERLASTSALICVVSGCFAAWHLFTWASSDGQLDSFFHAALTCLAAYGFTEVAREVRGLLAHELAREGETCLQAKYRRQREERAEREQLAHIMPVEPRPEPRWEPDGLEEGG